MPPPGGVRTPLNPDRFAVAPYTRADTRNDTRQFAVTTGDMTEYEAVFQPGGGIFTPGYPLAPPQPEAVRGYDFPTAVNTIYTPRAYEPITFAQLRALADTHDITRLAIETRKDQMEKLEWTIKPRDEKNPQKDADSRVDECTAFFTKPDRQHPFATWLRMEMEDLLVLDAPAMEIRRNRGGQVIGLDPVAGETIKVLIDDYGRLPAPPAPAYMQIIKGRPWRLLTTDELLYMPRNPRAHKQYGYGPVEQIIMTVNIGLRRQIKQLQHFTDGNIPMGMINAPEGWTVEQLTQYQEAFDAKLAGNTAEQVRLIWGPFGAKWQAFREAPFKDEFDEWLSRVVCYAFSLPPTAFVRQMNRATAESSQETAIEEGLAPLMGWVKRLADFVIQVLMGYDDLEFAWQDIKPVNATEQAAVIEKYVRDGVWTRDEARDILGMEPFPGGTGNVPLITAGATIMRLEDAIQEPPDPIELARVQAEAKASAQPPGATGAASSAGNGKPKPGKTATQAPAKGAAGKGKNGNGKPAKKAEGAGEADDPLGKATAAEVDAAAAQAHPEPSQAQIEAGNYRKGHVRVHGLDVTIENPKGSTRRGVSPNGEPWEAELPAHYGYIRRTVGADDEQVDVFIGPNPEADTAFVVDQTHGEGSGFDEHKILLGYDSLDAALADYRAAFTDGKDRVGAVHRISVDGLKEWLRTGDLSAPIGTRVGKAYGFAARGWITASRQRALGPEGWQARY